MYILKTDVVNDDNNEIIPQVQDMGPGYDFDSPSSLTRIAPNVPLTISPDLHAFQLDPETKLTDVVSQGYVFSSGLLISEAFAQALEGHVVQRHQLYPADVVFHDVTYRYFWLHFTEEVEERIDYARSEFVVEPLDGGSTREVSIATRGELRTTAMQLVDTLTGELKARRLAFLPGTPAFDLFCVLLTTRTFFASDELAQSLSAAQLTGFTLAPSDVELFVP